MSWRQSSSGRSELYTLVSCPVGRKRTDAGAITGITPSLSAVVKALDFYLRNTPKECLY
jgi:hypothetical protein